MIFYRLLALTDLLFVGFILRVVLGELKILDEVSSSLFVIFLGLISVLTLVVIFISKKEKTVTYKGKQITITNDDRMFIKLIRQSDYKVNKKLEKLVTNQGEKLAKMTSLLVTLAIFIRIAQIINLKISLAQNGKLMILMIVMSVMFL